jgi:hypothetical protein
MTLVVCAVLTVVGVGFVSSMRVAEAARGRAVAQAGADAAALAAASVQGDATAVAGVVAGRNGVDVVSVHEEPETVEVTVRSRDRDGAVATARAQRGSPAAGRVTIDVWVPIDDPVGEPQGT